MRMFQQHRGQVAVSVGWRHSQAFFGGSDCWGVTGAGTGRMGVECHHGGRGIDTDGQALESTLS
jgi:hypothetical protein